MSLTNYVLCVSVFVLSFVSLNVPVTNSSDSKQDTSMQDSTGVKIRMVPIDVLAPAKGKPYRVGNNVRLKIIVTNNFNAIIKALVVDTYYQNRPKLFKDGHLVAYREETAKLVRSKDADPEFVRVGSIVSLLPTTTTDLEELNLADWYAPLQPGLYTLTNRHRFEVGEPWSGDSEKLLFEVAPQQ